MENSKLSIDVKADVADITQPAERVINKVMDSVKQSTGRLFQPWQIRRIALADAQKELTQAQTEKDIQDIKSGRKQYDIVNRKMIDVATFEDMEDVAQAIIQVSGDNQKARQLQEDVNWEKVLIFAEEKANQLPTNAAIDDKPIDLDWFQRFYDAAKKVHDDQLRELFANLLISEAQNSNSHSVRVIEFLASITRLEAHQINGIAKSLISDVIYFDNFEDMKNLGITPDFLVDLEGMGILTHLYGAGLKSSHETSYEKDLKFFDYEIKLRHENKDALSDLDVMGKYRRLMPFGEKVMSIIDAKPNTESLKIFCKIIIDKGIKIEISRRRANISLRTQDDLSRIAEI